MVVKKNWRPENECGDAFKETLEGLVNVEGSPESKYLLSKVSFLTWFDRFRLKLEYGTRHDRHEKTGLKNQQHLIGPGPPGINST